jgi:hypothetical protein
VSIEKKWRRKKVALPAKARSPSIPTQPLDIWRDRAAKSELWIETGATGFYLVTPGA